RETSRPPGRRHVPPPTFTARSYVLQVNSVQVSGRGDTAFEIEPLQAAVWPRWRSVGGAAAAGAAHATAASMLKPTTTTNLRTTNPSPLPSRRAGYAARGGDALRAGGTAQKELAELLEHVAGVLEDVAPV